MMYSLCDHWEFHMQWNEEFLRGGGAAVPVRLPHTVRELPLHYIDPADYQMVCGYRRELCLPPEAKGRRIFLQFDGAAHIATVYVNGTEAAIHRCGYTAFRVEITDLVRLDGPNRIAVRLDSTENSAIPPFGFVIDYLTYGGLYREAWLDIRQQGYIQDIYITTPDLETAEIRVKTDGAPAGSTCTVAVLDEAKRTLWEQTAECGRFTAHIPGVLPWDTEHPNRYTCAVELHAPDGSVWDRQAVQFGFRTAEFRADGFYLNGKKTFLRGLNRHQSFPYVGYAAPEALQREDARILQEELGCNAVRTSHYPQSQYFLDECDRRGLLVFTEFPGWQHVGAQAWKEQACENLREMILQNRNHPSIVLWGVRINESIDDDAFYTRTNAIAHELDPSRCTSGVRYLEKSSLLEDVYAYNDFSHTGNNPGAKPKKDVTPDLGKALLISECNGHMYPTKPYDDWPHRQEHALRHVRVQNAAYASGQHAGCFGWCMFDYPTHRDFGSGDRICYHGVMDAFRNPKLAAAVYQSQQDAIPVLEVSSSMDIGDYPAGQVGEVYAFTNADRVALYKNDQYVTDLRPGPWTALPHPPLLADDLIGSLLESQEGFPKKKADLIRSCLLAAQKHTLANLPLRYKLKLLWCMARYHMSMDDGVALYGKYVGNWGGEATCWRFDAIQDGQVVKRVTRGAAAGLHLEAIPSHTTLVEGDSYDMAAVRVRILDAFENPAHYAQLPVTFELEGAGALVGPTTVTAEGGMCGTYVRTLGAAGIARLTIRTGQTAPVHLTFSVKIEEERKCI